MATDHLINDGAWGTAANWQPGGGVPENGDTAIIGPSLAANVTDAGGAADEYDYAVVHVHKGYQYSFGTTGAPIRFASALVQLNSSGPCFLESDLMGGSADINEIIGALARPDVVCEIGSTTGDAGEIDSIKLYRGTYTLKANINYASATEVLVDCVKNRGSDVNLTISAGGEAVPVLRQTGGNANVASAVTILHLSHATYRQTTAAIATGHIRDGGYLRYDHTAVDGDNTVFHVYAGGILDFTQNEVYKTVDSVFVYPGGTFLYDPKLTSFAVGLVDYSRSVA